MSSVRLSFQATLTCVVFAAGVGTLATEIAASRLLAPYFGNSTIVWANVIGLTLASLSVGYWLGGRLADRYPTPRALGLVVAAAACLVAFATLVARPILDFSVEGLDRVSAGAAIGSFFGVLILFVPPVTLMGMVAPFAIRLAIRDIEAREPSPAACMRSRRSAACWAPSLPRLSPSPRSGRSARCLRRQR